MQAQNTELSNAVVLYLGFGLFPYPQPNADRINHAFSAEKAALLALQVNSLINESFRVEINWTKHSLASAGDEVYRQMQARHPYLSETALRALIWKFTFDWR